METTKQDINQYKILHDPVKIWAHPRKSIMQITINRMQILPAYDFDYITQIPSKMEI